MHVTGEEIRCFTGVVLFQKHCFTAYTKGEDSRWTTVVAKFAVKLSQGNFHWISKLRNTIAIVNFSALLSNTTLFKASGRH
jgi:hypothetical protein